MVASDLACALDPSSMARRLGITPDPWQERLLRSQSRRILLNCSRQSGKSTTTALLAVHTALYAPPAPILLLSPSLRQSGELFKMCLAVYRELGRPARSVSENALSLELRNGARIISLPGKEGTVRGYSGVGLLVIDEAAQVSDELYYTLRPMLAVSHGRLIAPSTPFAKRGWWHGAWSGPEDWERYEVPATQVPRITKEFLEEERRTLGEFWYQQEYECQFLDSQTQAFGRDEIDRAFREEIEPWQL